MGQPANQSGLNYKGILTNDDIKDFKDKVHLKAVSIILRSFIVVIYLMKLW